MTDNAIQIEKLLVDLRNNYITEFPTRLNELDNIILGFETSINKGESYGDLFRHIHSIKGSSATHGLHIFSTICHEFEDTISIYESNLSKVKSDDLESWLKYVDLLKKAHSIIADRGNVFSSIEQELEKLRSTNSKNKLLYRCLLVSPTKLQKQICESVLLESKTSISVANDGYEALGRLLTTKYDFLISNHEISMLNGVALVSAIRTSNNQNKDIQSVLMTSNKTLTLNRYTDPDYILFKDDQLAENLSTVVIEIIENLNAECLMNE